MHLCPQQFDVAEFGSFQRLCYLLGLLGFFCPSYSAVTNWFSFRVRVNSCLQAEMVREITSNSLNFSMCLSSHRQTTKIDYIHEMRNLNFRDPTNQQNQLPRQQCFYALYKIPAESGSLRGGFAKALTSQQQVLKTQQPFLLKQMQRWVVCLLFILLQQLAVKACLKSRSKSLFVRRLDPYGIL